MDPSETPPQPSLRNADCAGFETATSRLETAQQLLETGAYDTVAEIVLDVYDGRNSRTPAYAPPDGTEHRLVSKVAYACYDQSDRLATPALEELIQLYDDALHRAEHDITMFSSNNATVDDIITPANFDS